MRVAFLNHPLGAVQDMDRVVTARDASWRTMSNNIADAYEWTRFLVANVLPRIVVLSPAITYAASEIQGPKILAMMATVLPRCDMLVDVNWFSPHMGILHNHARNRGIPAVNLTRFGRSPPWDDATAIKEINADIGAARTAKARSVWMPPLSATDVMALRDAEEKLVADPDNLVAVQVLREIITAASKP